MPRLMRGLFIYSPFYALGGTMTNNTTNKNELIQEQVRELIIDPIASETVVLSNSTRIIDSATADKIPRLTNTSGVWYVGAWQQINEHHTLTNTEVNIIHL